MTETLGMFYYFHFCKLFAFIFVKYNIYLLPETKRSVYKFLYLITVYTVRTNTKYISKKLEKKI